MFKKVGKTIKDRAEGYVFWRATVSVFIAGIGGLVVFPLFADGNDVPTWTVLLYFAILIGAPLITYFHCREKAMLIYAYGQLVDDVQTIRECMRPETAEAEPDPEEVIERIVVKKEVSCFCSVCGNPVKEDARFCSSCGTEL